MKIKVFKYQSEDIELEFIEDENFDFLLSNSEVAKGYGVSEGNIRELKRVKKDELFEHKHFVFREVQTKGGKQKKIFWTKRGVVRLGFFIKSERAKKFRDWAEDLILQKVENDFSQNFDLQKIRERAELLEISEKEFGVFERVFYKIGITRKEELAITSNRAVKKETGVDFIELAEKKGISTPEKYFTVTELCQKVMDSDKFSDETKKLVSTKAGDKPRPQNLNKILESHGFQTKIDGIWKPTEKAKDFSDFVQNKSQYSEKTVFHTVWKVETLEEVF